jgi:hypothetical protein
MRFGRRALLLLLALWLPASMALAAGQEATIRSSYKHGPKAFHSVGVIMSYVDGKSPGGFWRFGPTTKIPSGNHSFLLSIVFFRGFIKGQHDAEVTVEATILPGHKYQTVASNDGKKVEAWIIEMASGKRVSTVGTVTKYTVCHPPYC